MKDDYQMRLKTSQLFARCKSIFLNKSLMAAGIVSLLSYGAMAQTNFYLRLDSLNPTTKARVLIPVYNVLAWTTDPLGAKASTPVNFTNDGQIFNIQTNGYTNNRRWAVTGVGSKIVIGTQDSTALFTSNATSNLVATVDVTAKGTLVYAGANTDSLSLGTLATGSTVRFSGSTFVNQKVISANYYNLGLPNGGGILPVVLPSSLSVAGVLTYNGGSAVLNYGSTINFNGTGGQAIPAANYYNLAISGAKATPDTLKGNIGVAGAFTNTSTGSALVLGTSVVSYNSLAAQSIFHGAYNSLSFTNGQALFVSSYNYNAKTITLFGKYPDLAVNDKVIDALGTGNKPLAYAASSGGLYLDSSTVVSSISNDTVITLSNAPTLRLIAYKVGHTAVLDTEFVASYSILDSSLTLTNAPAFSVGDTVACQVLVNKTATVYAIVTAINGNVVNVNLNKFNKLNYLGTLSFGTTNAKPSDKDVTNQNISILTTFTPGTGNVSTANSTFSFIGKRQTVPALEYYNLDINQDSATAARLAGAARVDGALTLTSGKLTTTGGTLLTLSANATAPLPTNDTFFVSGPLAKDFASASSFTLPIGAIKAGLGYSKHVTVTPTTADTKTLTVSYTYGPKFPNPTSIDTTTLSGLDTVGYFTVTPSKLTGDTTALLTFPYNYDTAVSSGLVLANYINGKWRADGITHVPTNTNSGTITTNWPIFKYGNFAFGFISPILAPVKLVSFTGSNTAVGNVVKWTTATETNSNEYTVERKNAAGDFVAVGTIKATGKATSTYSFVDNNLSFVASTYYYRLAEVDNDGKIVYSPTIAISAGKNNPLALRVYPNPVQGQLNLFVSSPATDNISLQISDISGRVLKTLKSSLISGENLLSVDVSGFKAGSYQVTGFNNSYEKVAVRFIVK